MASCDNSSLKLLLAYNSSDDDSEEDIPGPRVSVKRAFPGSDNVEQRCKRRVTEQKDRLPLPSSLLPTFPERGDSSTANEKQNGRIRSFPHERGNWASYVYIAVEPSPSITSFIDVVCSTCEPSLNIERASDLHISLTKTVVLKHHWIDSISSSVLNLAQSIPSFPVCFGEMRVYTNEEQTRTFIGVVITAGNEMLLKIARRLDEILADFKLPPFYEEASFHFSIASCVGNHSTSLKANLSQLQTYLDMFIHSNPLEWSLNVQKLNLRTGNKYFSFNCTS